jgi:hypothetical protein
MPEAQAHPGSRPVEVLGLTDTVSPSKGLRTMWRVLRIGMETPWQVAFALVSTLFAAVLQLIIPQLLGRAVDQTQVVATGGDDAATRALLITALLVLAESTLRGLFATFQNYFSEAVGHHTGLRLRLDTRDWFKGGTIPGAIRIPYTCVVDELLQLGCEPDFDGWYCKASNLFLQWHLLWPASDGDPQHDQRRIPRKPDFLSA